MVMRKFFLFSALLCLASQSYAQVDSAVDPGKNSSSSTELEAKPKTLETQVTYPINLVNPGFETGMSSGKLPGWRISQHTGSEAYSMTIDTENAAEGKQSFRMERTREQVYGLIEQIVAIPEGLNGKPMTYSAMLKTDGVGDDGWCLVVTFHGGTGAILDQKRSQPMIGTHDWSRVTVETVPPAGTRTVAAGVLLLDKGTGWIDDNQLSVVASAVPRE